MDPHTPTPPTPKHRYFSTTPQPTPGTTLRASRGQSITGRGLTLTLGSKNASPFHIFILTLLLLLVPQTGCFSDPSYATQRLSASSYETYEHELWLEESGAFVVQWTPRQDDVEFRVIARTTGYLGFGLSSKPRMDGADIVVGWVHSGKAYLQDRHGRGNKEPAVDQQRDWLLVGGYENDTHTVLIMSRPYNTCDSHDHVISNDTVRLLWAYHPDDPVDPESPRPRLHYHGGTRRGSRTIFLLERGHKTPVRTFPYYLPGAGRPPSPPPSLPHATPTSHHHHHHHHHRHNPTTHSWVLTNPGVVVQEKDDTVYWCKVFRRPDLVQKNHVIRYEPVFTPGNEKYVHHIIVYECTDLAEEQQEVFEGLAASAGSGCYEKEILQHIETCNHVVVTWAVGSEGLSLPPEAGYPLTPRGPKYYMMETHYDNPEGHRFKDESGIKITYTHEIRYHDAGVLSVGLDPNWKHLIPPKQRTVLSEGHCVGECTQLVFPPSGIHVFAVILHTHLLGRKVRVRHLRNGRELEPIAQDNNYDFSYQEYRALHRPRTVLPGDHLIGECTYNSRERSSITLGGFKTRDEMCLSFLFYWPQVNLSLCHSKPSLKTVLHSLGIKELSANSNPITIRRPMELAGKTLEWRLMNYDWKSQFENFQHTTHTGTYNPMCWNRGESIIPHIEEEDLQYPNITDPWAAENVCRRRKRKNRRRKNKVGRGRPHLEDEEAVEDEEDEEEGGDEGEVMFDDQINHRTIERVDVDPFGHRHLFMPVLEGRGEGGEGVESVQVAAAPEANPEEEMKELEEEIEADLEMELAGKERTAPRNKMGVAGGCGRVSLHWTLWVWAWCLWAVGASRGLAPRQG
ncbi:MOXD1 homolog 2-like [Portunus trituberculatus]|uniref:MOXD1 homolog 2-like n=1 Tax=Portunus trituberculatus TaxID=210409 RepID=UPI001E1D011B|nr:MOXD1 homolog 2-like [Portunus trituberculatus]XP_045118858.1 MOXD1 homolog 2-like [Portunus trituberculatus]